MVSDQISASRDALFECYRRLIRAETIISHPFEHLFKP